MMKKTHGRINQRKKSPLLSAVLLCFLLAPAAQLGAGTAQDQDGQTGVTESQAPVKHVSTQEEPTALNFTKPEAAGETATSTDFLMETSPLQKPEAVPDLLSDPESQLAAAAFEAEMLQMPVEAITIPDTGKAPLPMAVEAHKPDDVAMLVSEFCTGGGSEGAVTCDRVYSNGHHAMVVTQKMIEGDETKLQSVVEEYDREDALVFKKTVRHRTDYNYYNDEKSPEKELIDIMYQPAGGKTTRELMVRQYHLDTGKTRSLTWTQYEQIGNSDRAALVYNATLSYDPKGTPERGLAERWDRGQKVATYIDWDAAKQGRMMFDRENWREWESWIQSISLHAYLT